MEAASSSTASVQGRQKRVLPSRSRRGGPGVGTHDMDVMILDAYKRKLESEPLIPTDAPFMLTTNSSKFSGDSENSAEVAITINTVSNDRYFDRPEVLRAFRQQEIIQTPDFEAINESSTVGGRFRPRGAEDESAETSDAAYEKRHKKFETFEKRQRLREKEKLKHEHYKLKERIEQLRAMDGSAFMAVPAASFSAPPPQQAVEVDEVLAQGSPYAQLNGTAHTEGERRRKEMLDNAISLEKRYSYLLPPDRVRKTQDSVPEKNQVDSRDEDESDTEKLSHAGPSRKEPESIRFRIPARSSASTTPAPSPAAAKPAVKKPRATAQVKQSASFRSIQHSVAYATSQERIPSASSSLIDVETLTPEPAPSVPLSPSYAPPPIESSGPSTYPVITASKNLSALRASNGRGTRAQTNGSAISTSTNGIKPAEKAAATPVAPQKVVEEDGESEKALSDDGDALAPESEAPPAPAPVELVSKSTNDTVNAGQEEISPEVREIATRMEQTGFGDVDDSHQLPSQHIEQGPSAMEGFPHAEAAPVEESISTRPTKRARKMTAKAKSLQSAAQSEPRTESVPPVAESASVRHARTYGPRGQQSQTYISSTGEETRTHSFLIMAAIRTEGAKRNIEKRHNTSFGIVTPAFRESYDFEIPEWLHYPDPDESRLPIAAPEPEPEPIVPESAEPATEESAPPVAQNDDKEKLTRVEPEETLDAEKTASAVQDEVAPTDPEGFNVQAEAVESDTTEPMQIDEPDPIQEDLAAELVPTERADDTDNEEDLPPVEHEPEPGVSIRVLSAPRDDDEDEQLEW